MEHRRSVQRRIMELVGALNQDLADAVAVPFKLTAGDEIQGLLRDPRAAVEILRRAGDEVHPERFVWGLGAGEIATDLSTDVSMIDGPCLHRARDAVTQAGSSGRWLEANGLPPFETTLLSALLDLLGAIRSEWTDKELLYAREARLHSQTAVAEKLDVNQSTVSRALARAHFRTVVDGENAARALLASLTEGARARGEA